MTKRQAAARFSGCFVPWLLAMIAAGCGGAGTKSGTGGGTGGMSGSVGTGGRVATGGAVGSGGVNGNGTGGISPGGGPGTGGSVPDTGGAPGGGGGGADQPAGTGGARTGGGGAGMPPGGQGGVPAGGAPAAGHGGLPIGGTSGVGGAAGGGPSAFDPTPVKSIMRRVADYEIARFGNNNSNGWVRAAFHTGMLAAYRALGDVTYRDYTRQWGLANSWLVSKDASNGPRFADNQACFQSYAELYLADPVASNNVMIASAQMVFDSMVAAPMAGRTEWWWCDSLFMAPPALARLAKATGKAEYLTLMHAMFWDTKAFLFDPAQSLFWRDSTFRNKNIYWSRGNGWVVAGIARILEVLPATDARRKDYEDLLRVMATKLRDIQASDGFWRSGLTDQTSYTTPESSGTAFFCYGLAWGINNGVLDRAMFLPTVTKAWNALVGAVDAQGRLGWVQAVGSQPGPSTMASTNDYATGAFLLSGAEILKL